MHATSCFVHACLRRVCPRVSAREFSPIGGHDLADDERPSLPIFLRMLSRMQRERTSFQLFIPAPRLMFCYDILLRETLICTSNSEPVTE